MTTTSLRIVFSIIFCTVLSTFSVPGSAGESKTLLNGISFDERSIVLQLSDTADPAFFESIEIAGADENYRKATVTVDGTKIRLSHDSISSPRKLRFAGGVPLSLKATVSDAAGRDSFDALIPDAKRFELLYRFDPTSPVMTDKQQRMEYQADRSGEIKGRKIKRVGYFLRLKPKNGEEQYVFVTMPPLSDDPVKLGAPTKASGARFQQKISDVTIESNVPGLPTGTFAEGCNIEFWDCSYDVANEIDIPNASDTAYDFGDKMRTSTSPGFGSMQIHHYEKKQTIFAFNAFAKEKSCDIGIGNCPKGKNPDWTHSKSAATYSEGVFLILVETE